MVDKLVEGVLAVGAALAPDDGLWSVRRQMPSNSPQSGS